MLIPPTKAFSRFTGQDGSAWKRALVWLAILGVALLGGLVFALLIIEAQLYDGPRPMANAYYVWQMQWSDPVREAVANASPEADRLMVLLGEVNAAEGTLRFTPAKPDWAALAQEKPKVALVLRANAGLGPLLSGDQLGEAGSYLHGILDSATITAKDAGVDVAGVQLDYDCPTSKLQDYRRLLDAMRMQLGDVDLSITVLPTWLKQWDFPNLVEGLAYYVLQVHSLETPTSVDRPIVLCDTSRIPGYLRRAAWIGVPFYLALPTYGYRVAFDANGRFTSLSAEGPTPAWDHSHQVRLVMSDPAQIAAVVRTVMDKPPRGCRGFAWFRMPHSRDELNWSWPTLVAVREGRVPHTTFEVEIRNPSSGLYEAWLTNTGETRIWTPVTFDVRWDGLRIVALDTLGGFEGLPDHSSRSIRLTGPAPHNSEPVMAAWFRSEDVDSGSTDELRAGPVVVLP